MPFSEYCDSKVRRHRAEATKWTFFPLSKAYFHQIKKPAWGLVHGQDVWKEKKYMGEKRNKRESLLEFVFLVFCLRDTHLEIQTASTSLRRSAPSKTAPSCSAIPVADGPLMAKNIIDCPVHRYLFLTLIKRQHEECCPDAWPGERVCGEMTGILRKIASKMDVRFIPLLS
ncbi:hypothetical protein Tcan_00812, partial [Toxocara canis]